MFIVMHCMGIPFNGETVKTQSLGGSETAAYYMAKELAAKGNEVILFTNSTEEGTWDGVKYIYTGQATEQAPLGDRFQHYAMSTPHDVLIIQRHPQAFVQPWAAKIKLWWVHDLAVVRQAPAVQSMLWNVDGILTVSEFHKQQYAEVYGINPDIIYPIQNGIDLELFEGEIQNTLVHEHLGENYLVSDNPEDIERYMESSNKKFKLLYTSRPERGLEHLLANNGIMERLADKCPNAHLYVCGYENKTEQMAPYYDYLYKRCEELPNVTNLGSLTKQELADVMRQCDLLVYPTPGPMQLNFEEVSCITAMEAMAAGLPFVSSDKGALAETCKDSGSVLLPLKDGTPDIDAFTGEIVTLYYDAERRKELADSQHFAARKFAWSEAAGMLLRHVQSCFEKNRSPGAVIRSLIEHSDIYGVDKYAEGLIGGEAFHCSPIVMGAYKELQECYDFALNEKPYFAEYYKEVYDREQERGVNYGPENLQGNDRFESVATIVDHFADGDHILDYGCAHGHYTINLAKRFPNLLFTGIDITLSNIDKARAWAKQEGLANVKFIHGRVSESRDEIEVLSSRKEEVTLDPTHEAWRFDGIIAAEVIEHVATPTKHVGVLRRYLKNDGRIIITVPFGPWEAQGYKEHWPWRAHLWHFERQDLYDLWGHLDGFELYTVPAGLGKEGTMLGSQIVIFGKSKGKEQGAIDLDRKFQWTKPRQTVSLCMIAKDAEDTIKRSLDSVSNFVDEIIIALDETTTDRTRNMIDMFCDDKQGIWPLVKVIDIPSPMEIGFDEARNLSIAEADGDWVLWMDSDEVLVNPQNMYKYLRNNQFNGYAVKQHHFAIEPLGVLKTDLPCRLFRNHHGIKFFGVVHEHPEIKLNEGIGHVQLIHDLEIAHHGYTTEAIRRGRFDRNIDLMVRDREKYPDRNLGKFLWIRDLSQMCRYEMEINGGRITKPMMQRAEDGIALWEELLEADQIRMIVDGIEFYSMLAKILDTGFEAGFMIETSKANGGVHMERAQPVHGYFAKREHLEKLTSKLIDEKVNGYDSKYF